jgi:hypothetical protein
MFNETPSWLLSDSVERAVQEVFASWEVVKYALGSVIRADLGDRTNPVRFHGYVIAGEFRK